MLAPGPSSSRTAAFDVHHAEIVLGFSQTTVGGATIPIHGHVVLLGHTQPLFVQIADVVLCLRIPGMARSYHARIAVA